jgi:sec-independent protein translocase protein TatC
MALVPFPGPQSGALQRAPGEAIEAVDAVDDIADRVSHTGGAPPEPDDELAAGGKMSFLEHLEELRKRIIYAALGILFGVAASIYWIGDIVDFLLAPAKKALPPGTAGLIMTQPGEGFSLWVTVSLIAGAVVASPIIMWQVWRFVAPGLYSNEKRFAVPFVCLTSLGFVGGAAFNHYVAFPSLMAFFATFGAPDIFYYPTISLVFGLYTKMLIGLGLVFQMPALIFFLAKMKVVSARFLIGKFRYAVLLFVSLAAILTPTSDPVNLLIFTAPMIALYGLSIVIAWLVGPRRGAGLHEI